MDQIMLLLLVFFGGFFLASFFAVWPQTTLSDHSPVLGVKGVRYIGIGGMLVSSIIGFLIKMT